MEWQNFGKMQPCNLSYVPVASDDPYDGLGLGASILVSPLVDAGTLIVACDLTDKERRGEWAFTMPFPALFNKMLESFRCGDNTLTENWEDVSLAYAACLEAEAARVRAKVGQERFLQGTEDAK